MSVPESSYWSIALRAATLSIAIVTLPACGERSTAVVGTVYVDGRPMQVTPGECATVVFRSLNRKTPLATGVVDGRGRYRLAVGGSADVTPGEYEVAVAAVEVAPATVDNPQPVGRRITAERYADPTESGLKFMVHSGENEISLELSSSSALADGNPDRVEGVDSARSGPRIISNGWLSETGEHDD